MSKQASDRPETMLRTAFQAISNGNSVDLSLFTTEIYRKCPETASTHAHLQLRPQF